MPHLLLAAALCKNAISLGLLIVPYDQESTLKRPYLNEQARVKLQIAYNCKSGDAIDIPWRLTVADMEIAHGSIPLAPSTGVELPITWVPKVPGKLTVRAEAEDAVAERTIDVQRYESQRLSFEKARAAGAFFGSTSGPSSACVVDAMDAADATVRIEATCSANARFEGDVRAFDKFGFKNAWRVKSVEAVKPEQHSADAYLSEVVMPAAGSMSPLMKFNAVVAAGTSTYATYTVVIEGPQGTDPYR